MNKYDILRLVLNFFELLACIVGIACFKNVRNNYWKWFVVYLTVIVFAELLSEYLLMIKHLPNQWIYTWFVIPFEFLFFFWLYFQYFKNTSYRNQLFLLVTTGYLTCYIVDMVYLRKLQFAFSSFSYMAGSIFLLVLIIIFFIKLIRSNEILEYKKDMMFWVSVGLLIFFLGSLPFYGLWNTLRYNYPNGFNTYWIVQIGFDFIMYIFFALAFIWGKPK